MKSKIQFRLLEDKAPVTATYPAQTQSNEQNTRKHSDEQTEEWMTLRNKTQ
jgi:hypothetical protein